MPDEKPTAADAAPSAPTADEELEKERRQYLAGVDADFDENDDELMKADRGDFVEDPDAEKKDEDDGTVASDDDSGEAEEKDEEGAEDDVAGEESESEGDADEDEGDSQDSEGEKAESDERAGDESQEEEPAAKVQGIPKHRFDEVNERRRVAEEELARRDAEIAAAEQAEEEKYDFDAAEDEYIELLLDGKKDEAKAKRREIRAADRAEVRAESTADATTKIRGENAMAEVADLTDQAQELYPVFDDNHADFSPEITSKAMSFYRGYLADPPPTVKSAGDALVMALADVIQLYDLDTRYGFSEAKQQDGAGDRGDEVQNEGKKEEKLPPKKDIEKKLKDAENAPAPVATGGDKGDSAGAVVPNIEKMSDEEIDALPPATLARMRGDFVE